MHIFVLKLTYVIQGPGAKLWVEDLGPEGLEVIDDKGPQFEDIIPGDVVPHLYDNHAGS